MDQVLEMALWNAIGATLLAGVAVAVGWVWRRPALHHALWLLVFIKLITPPVLAVPITWPVDSPAPRETIEIPVLPVVARVSLPVAAVEMPTMPIDEQSTAVEEPAVSAGPNWKSIALAIWLAGACFVWAITALRVVRFGRLLSALPEAPDAIRTKVAEVATRLGLRRVPIVSLVDAPISPMVWAVLGRQRLLIPAALWSTLDPSARNLLLAHELAHLRRRDHWVRAFELVVVGLYWWHPVSWWARARLQETAEICCDALVVQVFPEAAPDYAQVLLDSADFLSRRGGFVPVGASGLGPVPLLRRRLTMILSCPVPQRVSWIGCALLFGLGALVLPIQPTQADPVQGGFNQPQEAQIVGQGRPGAAEPAQVDWAPTGGQKIVNRNTCQVCHLDNKPAADMMGGGGGSGMVGGPGGGSKMVFGSGKGNMTGGAAAGADVSGMGTNQAKQIAGGTGMGSGSAGPGGPSGLYRKAEVSPYQVQGQMGTVSGAGSYMAAGDQYRQGLVSNPFGQPTSRADLQAQIEVQQAKVSLEVAKIHAAKIELQHAEQDLSALTPEEDRTKRLKATQLIEKAKANLEVQTAAAEHARATLNLLRRQLGDQKQTPGLPGRPGGAQPNLRIETELHFVKDYWQPNPLPRGSQPWLTTALVNSSAKPIDNVKLTTNSSAVKAKIAKSSLAPGESATVEVSIDTTGFAGQRTFHVFATRNDKAQAYATMTIILESQERGPGGLPTGIQAPKEPGATDLEKRIEDLNRQIERLRKDMGERNKAVEPRDKAVSPNQQPVSDGVVLIVRKSEDGRQIAADLGKDHGITAGKEYLCFLIRDQAQLVGKIKAVEVSARAGVFTLVREDGLASGVQVREGDHLFLSSHMIR